MAFRELGYLSPESAQWIVTNRRDHGGWFSHVDRLNRLAQRTLFAASADEGLKAMGGLMPGIDLTRLSDIQEMEDLEYVERTKHFK